MSSFCSFSIFLFSAISLVVPSGFSYGASLLVLGSLVLLVFRPRFSFQLHDWVFILALVGYFAINVLLNLYHDLPASAYDKPARYLLAIPVYFLLINYPPKINYYWYGLMFAAIGTFFIAIYQQLFYLSGRSVGFLNAIQFGCIGVLFCGFLLVGTLRIYNSKKQIMVFVLFSIIALVASSLSFSRGAYFAIPCIFAVLYFACDNKARKMLIFYLLFFLIGCVFVYYFLPDAGRFKNRIAATIYEFRSWLYHGSKEYTSISTRALMWQSGVDAFRASPILGWGNLDVIKMHFSAQWLQLNELNKLDNFNHLHNEYIDALAKKGLVGFTALMAVYLVPLHYFVGLMRTRQADVMPFAAAGVILILCVMVFGLTQCFLAHNSGTMVFVFYLVIIKAYCRNIVAARIPAHQA